MKGAEIIECRATKWFYLRVWAMVIMFGVFLVLFLKDWKVGWPTKNEVYYTYKAFEKAEELFSGGEWTEEEWESEARTREIFPAGDVVLPAHVDRKARWPLQLSGYEGYRIAVVEEGNKPIPPMWASYTHERGWSSAIPEKSYDAKKIQEQLYYGVGSGVLLCGALFFLVRNSRRSMKVDGEAFYAPSGERVAFGSIRRIDVRKWRTKGLAYLFFENASLSAEPKGGALKKCKVDGMVYGQFRKENGAPAEALFQRILQNFKGELVELVEDEPESNRENVDNSGPDQQVEEVPSQE